MLSVGPFEAGAARSSLRVSASAWFGTVFLFILCVHLLWRVSHQLHRKGAPGDPQKFGELEWGDLPPFPGLVSADSAPWSFDLRRQIACSGAMTESRSRPANPWSHRMLWLHASDNKNLANDRALVAHENPFRAGYGDFVDTNVQRIILTSRLCADSSPSILKLRFRIRSPDDAGMIVITGPYLLSATISSINVQWTFAAASLSSSPASLR